MPQPLTCAVFAGGKSSRFKSNKALAKIEGKSLLEYVYEKMRACFDEVRIIVKDPSLIDFECRVLKETYEVFAPTAGFLTLFEQCSEDYIFVISVDTPFIGADIIDKMKAVDYRAYDAVVARCGGRTHPMCGIYNRGLYEAFLTMLHADKHSLNRLLREVHTSCVDFSDENCFFNINTKEEYETAKRLLKQGY